MMESLQQINKLTGFIKLMRKLFVAVHLCIVHLLIPLRNLVDHQHKNCATINPMVCVLNSGFWGIKQGAGEETEESWLCFRGTERDFQDELSNCTLNSLVLVHLKHKFKAWSTGVSGYRGCSKCLIVLYDSCAIAWLLQLLGIACDSRDALSETNGGRAHRCASPDLFIQA